MSYLLFSERQNPRDSPEISPELVTPDMGNGTSVDSSHDPILIMHYNDNVNLRDCFVHFPSRKITENMLCFQSFWQTGDAQML